MTEYDLASADRDAIALITAHLASPELGKDLSRALAAELDEMSRMHLGYGLASRCITFSLEYAGRMFEDGWVSEFQLSDMAALVAHETFMTGLGRVQNAPLRVALAEGKHSGNPELAAAEGTGLTGILVDDIPATLIGLKAGDDNGLAVTLFAQRVHLADDAAEVRRARWLDALAQVALAQLTEVSERAGEDPSEYLKKWALRTA